MRFSKGSFVVGILVGGFVGAAGVAYLASNVIEKNNKDILAFKNLAESQGVALGKCKDTIAPMVERMKTLMPQLQQQAAQGAQGAPVQPVQPVPVVPAR